MTEPQTSIAYAEESARSEANALALARAFEGERAGPALDPSLLSTTKLALVPGPRQLLTASADLAVWGDARPITSRAPWVPTSPLNVAPQGPGWAVIDFAGAESLVTSDTLDSLDLVPNKAWSMLFVVQYTAAGTTEPDLILDTSDPATSIRLGRVGSNFALYAADVLVAQVDGCDDGAWTTVEVVNDPSSGLLRLFSSKNSVVIPTPAWATGESLRLGTTTGSGSPWSGYLGAFVAASHIDETTLRGVRAWLPSVFGSTIRLPWAG